MRGGQKVGGQEIFQPLREGFAIVRKKEAEQSKQAEAERKGESREAFAHEVGRYGESAKKRKLVPEYETKEKGALQVTMQAMQGDAKKTAREGCSRICLPIPPESRGVRRRPLLGVFCQARAWSSNRWIARR